MEAQKLYKHKYFGNNVKALETIEDREGNFCEVWDFVKEKIVYVDTFQYTEMDGDVARCYETSNIENHSPVKPEKVLDLLKNNLKICASEDTAHVGYTKEEEKVIREFSEMVLANIKSYENGYED